VVLTLEKVVLEALPGHVLVHQHPVVVLVAEAHQLDQVRVAEHPEVHHLGLAMTKQVPFRSIPFHSIQRQDSQRQRNQTIDDQSARDSRRASTST
jgi:hypothetical protein